MNKPLEKLNIICFSNQLWDYPLWTNKKHVMTRLADRGHNVVFVNPPVNTGRVFVRHILSKKWSIRRLFQWIIKEKGNLAIVSPLNFVPFFKLLSHLHTLVIKKAADDIFDPNLKTVIWVYHVEIAGIETYLNKIKYDVLVYDCVDNYSAFPKYNTPEKKARIQAQEKYLAQKADVIFASAPGLVDLMKKYNSEVYFTPNVGDYERFSKVQSLKKEVPEDLNSIPRPRIAFTGAVDEYKFDRDLMRKIASDYPNYSFIVIGPMALKDREANLQELGLGGIDNIYFLGSRDYSLMSKYYAGFDVFIIPYQLNDYTVGGCFPIKFHEALAAGLPTIVTDMPAYRPFSEVCYISKSYNEFSQNIRKSIEENNDEKIRTRQKVAKENNWEGKVDTMINLIYSKLLQK